MNKSVKRGRNRSGRELGGKRAVSGCVKVVVGWILVTHDGNGGLRSCDHRHGVSVKNGVKRGSEAECYLKIASPAEKTTKTARFKVCGSQPLVSCGVHLHDIAIYSTA